MRDEHSASTDGYRIDRRSALKLAGMVGLGTVFSGTALAENGSVTIDPIEPERKPPWDELDGVPDQWARNLWFVELESPPAVRGGGRSAHADERAQLREEAADEDVEFTERHDFTTLWNGLSVRASLADAIVMSSLHSVSAVYPVARFDQPEPEEAGPELETALAMTGADRETLEETGAGYSVAVVDTGIDYNHPDLGGDGDPETEIRADPDTREFDHPRITHGWDYVGAGFDAADPDSPEPDPNPDPMDPQGHGTHVAGIVGADADGEDGVTGVAPEVNLGAYKVFDVGSSDADIIVAAMEDAYEDGMDVVNMSLGASLQWGQEYPTTAVSNELAEEGVVVVNSAGNDGGLGTWSMSAPANAHDIVSVASADNEFLEALAFEVESHEEPVPYLELSGAELPPTAGESDPLALPEQAEIDGEEGYFGCDPDDFAAFPDDHVALIERGHCPFAEKYLNAVEAGASGVVIFNDVSGTFSGTVEDDGVEGVWGASISKADGGDLIDLLEAGEDVRLGFTDEAVSVPNPDGGLLSAFSSYGQDVELAFGPSVTAPGGLITSTYPLELGEYAMLSGTSMSAPHVAGAVALLLEAEPDLDPLEVRDRLQNTAEAMPWSLNPDAGLDHSFRQGAGMLRIDRAIETDQRVTPGQLSVGDEESTTVTLTVTNDGDEDVTYDVGHEPTLTTAISTFEPTFFLTPEETVDAPGEVTVPAGGSADLEVTISAPGLGLPNHQYGGYVTMAAENGDDLRVPYAGYDGDYVEELKLLGFWDGDAESQAFVEQEPFLAKIVDEDEGELVTEPVEAGHEFTVREGDYPVIEAFFGHYPQEMRVYAVHHPSGREWPVMEDRYLPRSPDPETTWPFPWPGTTRAGRSENVRPVQSGTYTLRVELLSTLGDPENPDHWETWESPAFELDSRQARGRAPSIAPSPASAGDGR